jgi:formate/nitrite transporter FocA (FNT family)
MTWSQPDAEDDRDGTTRGADEIVDEEERADTHLSHTFHRSIVVGEERLRRSTTNLLATGFLGGMDIGIGVLALMVVRDVTGSAMLGALAFASGFITLSLARSELFTENFLVPVTVVFVERRHGWRLLRLWVGTLSANWAGGALFVGLAMVALPDLEGVAIELGRFYPELGIGVRSLTSAMLGGMLITLMTWIQRANREVVAVLTVAVVTGFLLAAPPLDHSVVGALEMCAGLFTGNAPYGWSDALGAATWAVLGNLLGGLGLVTVLRIVQVGADTIGRERRAAGISDESAYEAFMSSGERADA